MGRARLVGATVAAVLGLSGMLAAGAPAPPATERGLTGRLIVAPLSGEVDIGIAAFLRRAARDVGPGDLLILDIDTFGGRIDAAVQVRDALLGCRAKTVAFVHPRAISAGALIALATDVIVMSRGATIGAATPVQIEGGKMQPVEAKVVSYFRKEMKATAEAKGRPGELAEAMVDASVEIPGLDGKDTTLTLTTDEAITYKLAAFEAQSVDEIVAQLHAVPSSMTAVEPSWAERLARLLAGSVISSLLLTFGMLGIMVELWAPGHAVSGLVGLACLLLFAFGHYVVNLAGWETLLIFGAGATLVLVEIFFFPGHGVMVAIGMVLAVLALTESMVDLKHVPLDVSWAMGWLPRALTTRVRLAAGGGRDTGVPVALSAALAPWPRADPEGRRRRARRDRGAGPPRWRGRDRAAPDGKGADRRAPHRRGQRRRLHRAGNRDRGRRGRGHADRRAKETGRLIV